MTDHHGNNGDNNTDGKGSGKAHEIKVDTAALRTFGAFLSGLSDNLQTPLINIDTINSYAGNSEFMPEAGTFKRAVDDRQSAIKGNLTTIRNGLDRLSQNMSLIAQMYENNEDEATNLLPKLDNPISAGTPPPTAPPPSTQPPPQN